MRKSFRLLTLGLLAGCAVSAGAQGLGYVQYSDPPLNSPQTQLQAAFIGWSTDDRPDGQAGLDVIEIADKNLTIELTFDGLTYNLAYGTGYEIYADSGLITNGDITSAEQGNTLTISWSTEASRAGRPVGTYTLKLPQGLVKNLNGETNAAQTLTYRKVDPVTPTSITPATGIYSNMNTVTVTFDDEVALNKFSSNIELAPTEAGIDLDPWLIPKTRTTVGADGKSLVIDLSSLLDKGKWYFVRIPEGYVTVGENGVNGRIYEEYMYWDGMSQADLLSAPDKNSNKFEMKPFVLTWDYETITFTDAKPEPEVELVIGFPDFGWQMGERIMIPLDYLDKIHVDRDGTISDVTPSKPFNAIRLDLSAQAEDAPYEEFKVNFPAGMVKNAQGLENPPLQYNFSVRDVWPQATVAATDGVINMTYPNATWVTFNLQTPDIYLTEASTGEKTVLEYSWGDPAKYKAQVDLNNAGSAHGLMIYLNRYLNLADGNYIMSVPQGYLNVNGEINGVSHSAMSPEQSYRFGWKDGDFAPFQTGADDDVDTEAVITALGKGMWRIRWNDAEWVNPSYETSIYGETNPDYAILLLDSEENVAAKLYYKKEVTFPEYGNYFDIDLSSFNLAEGKYEVDVPEGYVNIKWKTGAPSETNVAQYLEITVSDNIVVTHPVSFTEVNDNYFDIIWENVSTLSEGNTTGAYIENQETGTKYDMFFLEGDLYSKANLRIVDNSYLRLNFTVNYPELPDGNYKLYIPAGYVYFNGDKNEVNEAIDGYGFTYSGAWNPGPVEVNGPSEDGIVNITWTLASKVELNEDYRGDGLGTEGVTVFDRKGELTLIPTTNISVAENVMTVSLNGLGIASGECQMLIPEDYLFITVERGTETNFEESVRFYYENPELGDEPDEPSMDLYPGNAAWNVSNGQTVDYNKVVEVFWPGTTIEYAGNAEASVGVHTPETGYLYAAWGREVTISEDNTKLLINLSNFPSGTFRLTVDEGYVIINAGARQYLNMSTWIENLTIVADSGVDAIGADDAEAEIYTVNGIRLQVDDIKTLPRGIYIVNGKKVVL